MSYDSGWSGGNDWDQFDSSKQQQQHFQDDMFDQGSEHFSYNIEAQNVYSNQHGFYDGTTAYNVQDNYFNPEMSQGHPGVASQYYSPADDPNSLYGQMSSSNLYHRGGKRSVLSNSPFSPNNYDEDEPPLLEELGINFSHIQQKTLTVLHPTKEADPAVCQDNDLAGPLVFALAFGTALLLAGKIHFNYIYGIGVLGSMGMYFLLNLMSVHGCGFLGVVSVLGYCLLPLVGLSALAVFLSLKSLLGLVLSIATVSWASFASSKLFACSLSMNGQQLLVAYPCALLYAVFALLTVF